MKQSIAQVWISALVITFMLIFSGYLAVTISYASTVKLKNGVLAIIEKRYGVTTRKGIAKKSKLTDNSEKTVYTGFGTLESISLYLRGNAYKNMGSCLEGRGDSKNAAENEWYGVYDLYKNVTPVRVESNTAVVEVNYEKAKTGKKYYYCFAKVHEGKDPKKGKAEAYYKVRLFYQLELPIINALTFTIDGKTNMIARPSFCEINDFKKSNIDGECPKRDGE